jgi:FG-GAP-like repeat
MTSRDDPGALAEPDRPCSDGGRKRGVPRPRRNGGTTHGHEGGGVGRLSPRRRRVSRAALFALAALLGAAGGADAADPVARDIAAAAGLGFQDGRLGLTQGETPVFDYDGDGQRDILLSTHNVSPWRLMRNKGNGTFAEALAETFARTDRHGCVARDLGGLGGSGRPDGRPDLYCVTGACQGRCEREYPNSLFIQGGDGTFRDVAAAWGADDPHGRGREAVALDYDKDGLLDLAVANQGPSIFPTPNRLFRNVGGGFREVTGTAVNSEKHSLFVEAGDIDGDGWTDLLFHSTINPGVRLVTYKNDRGTFKDVTAATAYRGVNARQVELADVDRDGRRDLLTLEKTRVSVWLNKSGTFPRRDFSFPLSQGRDVAAGDVNLDGAPDIYVVQGENNLYPDIMLINDGGGASFHTASIPQVTEGDGDIATAIPSWRGTGRAAFLVTNGKWATPGPFQLIVFSAP